MEIFNYKKEEVRSLILANRHNHITTTYYLILKKKTRLGKTSVSDLSSEEYIRYINDPKNLKENKKKQITTNNNNNANSTGKILTKYNIRKKLLLNNINFFIFRKSTINSLITKYY
jgi:hypothetical protein